MNANGEVRTGRLSSEGQDVVVESRTRVEIKIFQGQNELLPCPSLPAGLMPRKPRKFPVAWRQLGTTSPTWYPHSPGQTDKGIPVTLARRPDLSCSKLWRVEDGADPLAVSWTFGRAGMGCVLDMRLSVRFHE